MMDKDLVANLFVLRTGSGEKGEPALIFSTTSDYTFLWSTSKDHGGATATIWRPVAPSNEWHLLGDYVQQGYGTPVGTSLIVKAVNDDPNNPLLMQATTFDEIWNDQGSGSSYDGSIWRPHPPKNGYVPLGSVGQSGYASPAGLDYVCLRQDLVQAVTPTQVIWTDQGSHAHKDVSCWALPNVQSAFIGIPNYNSVFSGAAYAPKGM
jgi:hypothetical protein